MTSATMANSSFLTPDAAVHNHNAAVDGMDMTGNDNGHGLDAASLAAMFPHDSSDPFLDALRPVSYGTKDSTQGSTLSSHSSPGFTGRSQTLDSRASQTPNSTLARSNSFSDVTAGQQQQQQQQRGAKWSFGPSQEHHQSSNDSMHGSSSAQGMGFFNSPIAASPTDDRHSPFVPASQLPTSGQSAGPSASNQPSSFGQDFAVSGLPSHSQPHQSFPTYSHLAVEESSPSPAIKSEGGRSTNVLPQGMQSHDTYESSPADRGQTDSDAAAEKRQSSRFVYKLMRMVTDPDSQHLISFNPSGTSVVVTSFDDFAREVLPKHFKHSNFSSFIRQLNMYGFYKVNKTPRGQRNSADTQVWEFSHPKFIRGRYDLLDDIRRKALDADQSRVDARADLQFNMSLGHFQIKQLLDEMQWRLDHSAEENRRLRDFSLQMHSALVRILEYLKATSGGQLPLEIQLPMPDMVPSPMMQSPYGPNGPWGPPAQQPGHIPVYHVSPSHPQPSQMYHQDPQAGPSHVQSQQERPSIFVTEPGFAGPPPDPRVQPPNGPPLSPHGNGAFSMASLQGVSPLSSRRMSGASFHQDGTDYFDGSGQPNFGSHPGTPSVPATQDESVTGRNRGAIANIPRRSLSNRNDLAINTNLAVQNHNEQEPLSATSNLGAASVYSMPASSTGANPGLGVMAPRGQHPLSLSNAGFQHSAAHTGMLSAAVNTPLPPSPAIPGYGGGGDSPFVFSQGRFPSTGAPDGMPGDAFSNRPSPFLGPHPSNAEIPHSGFSTPLINGGDASFTLPMMGDDSFDQSIGPDESRPNAKAMRTPLKRTASNSAEAAAQAAIEAAKMMSGEVSPQPAHSTPMSITKRKSPA